MTDDRARGEVGGHPTRRAGWLLVGLLVLLAIPRWFRLEVDPPDTIVAGYTEQAHFRDEAAKGHEARNFAKWGRWSLSEHDEYGFWRAQSPSWVWGEALWFDVFGVGVVQARSFVVVHSLVALALLVWLALLRRGPPTAVAVALLLGFNWAYLVFSRLALMEGALLCWLVVATVALSQLERRPAQAGRWVVLATVAVLIACTIKQTGLLLIPAFCVALVLLAVRGVPRVDGARPWRERWRVRLAARGPRIALLAVAVLASVLMLLVLDPAYQRRLAFNAEHFTAARDQSVVVRAARTVVLGSGTTIGLMFMLAPTMLCLATVEVVRISRQAVARLSARRRGEPVGVWHATDAIDAWMLAWFGLALLANLASPHRAIRFHLVVLPPAAWLAAVLIGRLWARPWPSPVTTRTVRGRLVALALVGSGVTMVRWVEWTRGARGTAASIGAELTAVIGDRDAVVVGEFAAQAVFETDYRHFYVRPGQFNDDPETIAALGITHMVVRREDDFVEARMREVVPALLVDRRHLGVVQFRGQPLDVWALSPGRSPSTARAGAGHHDAGAR